jgi:hypothetical protein
MPFLQSLRRDLAGGRAARIGERRRVCFQRLRQRRRVDQALGEEQKREAGIDDCRFGGDGPRKGIRVGLVRGERRKARRIACARTRQLPSP